MLPFCLALLKRECKGIIYYNPFRIRQMLHVLCNYNTFGKLFLPTHMLGKSSNCARETFLHKVNFLVERNCKLDLGLQDLSPGPPLSTKTDTSTQPRTHISASLGSRSIHPMLYTCQNSSCTGSFHTPDCNTDAAQSRQALIHAPTVAFGIQVPAMLGSAFQLQWPGPFPKAEQKDPHIYNSTTDSRAAAGHENCPQGPLHTAVHTITLGPSSQAQEAPTSDLELKPHLSYVQDQNLQAPRVVLKLASSRFPYSR